MAPAALDDLVRDLVPECALELREDHRLQLRRLICSIAAVDAMQVMQDVGSRSVAAGEAFDRVLAAMMDIEWTDETRTTESGGD
jgi:hypothetical protein|tara:strand:+ start:362 stop:613 length:252 start_codon:yes stop_codon:yes gene_type:complete